MTVIYDYHSIIIINELKRMKHLFNLPLFIQTYRYFAIWLLMWVETFFPIFPSEVILPLGVQAANHGLMTVYGVAIAGIAGSMTGALVWYFVARHLGMERFGAFMTRFGRITTLSNREVNKLQGWFDHYGAIVVFVGRLVPGIRSAVSIPAGLTRMAFIPFFLLSLAGASLWTGTLTFICWLGRKYIEEMHEWINPAVKVIVVGCLLIWLYRVITYKPEEA
jgi:membrane protein DedA with SNARE-associated domain